MKKLYIECKMGAAGDMLMGALYELLDNKQKENFITTMNSIFPDAISVKAISDSRCNIMGTHMDVTIYGNTEHSMHGDKLHEHHEHHSSMHGDELHEHHEHHSSMPGDELHEHHEHHSSMPGDELHEHHEHHSYISVLEHINSLQIDTEAKNKAIDVYKCIGEAEAYVHGSTLDNIHFHEVGSLDAMCDVVGCSLLFHMLSVDEIIASPIHVGNGTVKCAHGILPVPAPATAKILEGVPFYTGNIYTELCTPTGAAILKTFATRFDCMPVMKVSKIGIGLGTKELETANCVRIFYEEENTNSTPLSDSIIELSCNIDDMTGEDLGFLMEILLKNGALDVTFSNIQMKKNRPGVQVNCFCQAQDINKFRDLIFKHTSTRGIRYIKYDRFKLSEQQSEVTSTLGSARLKISDGYGFHKQKYEYEDFKRIALENDLTISEVKRILSQNN